MSFIITLLVASTFVNDVVRLGLVSFLRKFESKSNAAAARDKKYFLFTLRPLPITPPPPRPQQPPLLPPLLVNKLRLFAASDTVRSLAVSAVTAVGADPAVISALVVKITSSANSFYEYVLGYSCKDRSVFYPAAKKSESGHRHPILQRAVFSADALPFHSASMARRLVAWTIDSAILYGATTFLRGSPFRGFVSAAFWLTRDFWLSPWGYQSPGRWAVSQVAIVTDIAREVNWAHAPPQAQVEEADATFKKSKQTPTLEPSAAALDSKVGHNFKLVGAQHDKDVYLMACFNSLRLFMSIFGPVGSLLFIVSSLPALSASGDGRTMWDRWMRVQVLNKEDILCWAYGCSEQNVTPFFQEVGENN